MARHICLINNDHDAELLSRGVAISCSQHQHISLRDAQLRASGTRARPWLDPDYNPHGRLDQPVSESFRPTAKWALVPHDACDGAGCDACDRGMVQSSKYLFVLTARDWQVINGAMQYAPIGSARPRRKLGRTHLKPVRAEKHGPVRLVLAVS